MTTRTCQLRRRISVVPEMHGLLRAYYEQHSVDDATAFALDLAAEEVFTNMVRHNESPHDTLSMTIEVTPESVHLQWIDHDVAPFDPKNRPPVDVARPIEERQPGGLGLHLTQSLVDRLDYTYEDGSLRVDVVKKLGA